MSTDIYKLVAAALMASSLAACGGSSGGGGDDSPSNGGGGGGGPTNVINDDPADLTARGQWGGLVLSGYGVNNNGDSNGELASEAVPTGATRYFGGDDNTDSSGTVQYVIIAESGFEFRPDQEVQGLTIEAAGSGTTIDYLQVLGSEDDGVEWFGGAASAKHVVINGADDDGLDFDEGFQGNIQFALVRQGSSNGDRGMEADNAGPGDDATPKTIPNLANITILGNAGKPSNSTIGALWRRGFGGKYWRSVIADDTPAGGAFESGCIDVDDQVDEDMAAIDVLVDCSAGTLVTSDDNFATEFSNGNGEGSTTVTYDVLETSANLNAATLAVGSGVAAPDNSAALPAGVEDAGYYGAVDPSAVSAADTWWGGWTYINSANDSSLAGDVDGSLPGNDFHPLQEEITNGTIAPASSNQCTSVNAGFTDGGTVEVFGQTFPVCVISEDIETDTSLPNNHIFVLNGTINVGDGDQQLSGGNASLNATLEIQEGTMIFGDSGSSSSLVITRGSQIDAQGSADMPIIMGAVDATL